MKDLTMQIATSSDFISILAQDKPPLILFQHSDDEQAEKIKQTLADIQSDFPALQAYAFVIDANDNNTILAEHLGIVKTPLLVVYKNGSFSRYKDKMFTKKSITEFVGSKKTYALATQSSSLAA